MRKLLLAATAAATFGGMTGLASAQAPSPPPGPPPANVVASGGQPWWGGTFSAYPSPTPEAGTYQAYFRSRLAFDAGVSNDSGNGVNNANKQNPFQFAEYARIYPAFVGTLANGMQYGAYMEVRQNSGGAQATGGTGGNTLFWRRQIGYVGGNWGSVRFGQGDGVLGYFLTGTLEATWGGSWNGDYPGTYNNAGTSVIWPFPENSGNYGSLKVVYLTPQWMGFDAGIHFQPSHSTSGGPECSAAIGSSISTCNPAISLSSGSFASGAGTWNGRGQLAREVNQIQGAVRWRGNAGPLAIVASPGFSVAGNLHDGGTSGTSASGAPKYQFATPWMMDFGTTVSFGNITFGGTFMYGAVAPDGSNNTLPKPRGAVNSTNFIVGGQYVIGPYQIIANYLQNNMQGAWAQDYAGTYNPVTKTQNTFGRSNQWGINIAGGYNYAPGCELDLTYLYGQTHQWGYDAINGAAGLSHNNTHAQGLILTNLFQW